MSDESGLSRTDLRTRLSLRREELAECLGVGIQTIDALTRGGELPHFRVGRVVLYPVEQVQAWLAGRAGPVVDPPSKGSSESCPQATDAVGSE